MPYRSAEIRPESTPLRRSKWALVSALAFSVALSAAAYIAFRYVAAGWIGYAVAGVVALVAVASLSDIGKGRVGACPRCDTPVEVRGASAGYVCPSCKTYLEIDRDQLLASREDTVAAKPVFGVQGGILIRLPDCCCVCLAPAVRRLPTTATVGAIEVPYCAEHDEGLSVRPHVLRFRSLAYAQRTAQDNAAELAGVNTPRDPKSERATGLAMGFVMTGLTALTYFGLRALESSNYVIVPASLKGIVLWLLITLVGWAWLTLGLGALAVFSFGMFLGSYRPTRAWPPR